MAKATIEVERAGDGEFDVHVREGGGETRHRVTMSDADWRRLCGGKVEREACLRAAFVFLLDHEPKESILSRFDVTVISRYFPSFERDLARYLPG